MEQYQYTEPAELLDLMIDPVFCVKDNIIRKVNQAAAKLLLREGMELSSLLLTGLDDYAEFRSGTLYVTLSVFHTPWNASVVKSGDLDIFTLDRRIESDTLQSLALAAMELRVPLSNAMATVQRIESSEDPDVLQAASTLNRSLYQILRMVSNMSDAGSYPDFSPEPQNMNSLFREIIEKASAFSVSTGIHLTFEGLKEDVIGYADDQILERAVLNLISNAMKFTPKGGSVKASLTRRGSSLRFHLSDTGSGIGDNIRGTVFQRYTRAPAPEDSRYGIGLGMLLVRNAAACHGGAVLIDQPEGTGTRITITLSLRHPNTGMLRTDKLRVDYAGEREHALLELSDVLPDSMYQDI